MALINQQTGQAFRPDENPFEAGSVGVDPALAKMKQEAFNKSFQKPVTPPPVNNQIPPQEETPVNRPVYNRPSNALDTVRGDLLNTLGSSETNMPSEEDIRQQELARAQAMIDATRGLYEEEVGRIKRQGAERLQETKSITTGAGLAGSPFRTTPEFRTQEATDQQIKLRQKERQAEIAQIMAAAEGRATDKFRDARDFARQQRLDKMTEQEAAINLLERQQEKARDTIKTLSQGGYSLDELSEQEYKNLLEDSGLSDFEARAIANMNNPASQADYAIEGGKLIGYFVDPVTGKPKISSQEIPGLEGVEEPNIQEFDGVPYVIGKDASGQITGQVLPGFKPKEESIGTPETQKVGDSLLQYNPQTNEWEVKFTEQSEVSQDSFLTKKLTPKEAQDYNLPLGSTYADAAQKEVVQKIDATTDVVSLIDSIKNDPAVSALTGPVGSRLPSLKTITGATGDLKKKVDRLTSLLTLENLDLMSGVLSESDIKILKEGGTLIDPSLRKGNFISELERLQDNALKEQYRMLGITDATYEEAKEKVGGIEKLRQIIQENLTELQKSPIQNQGSDFNQVGSDTNAAATDVSNIRDGARVATAVGSGTATGIERGSSANAYGLDLVLEGGKGAPTKAPISGKVIAVLPPSQTGGFGNQVKIQGEDGRIWTVNHLDGFDVKAGDTVRRGQTVIGRQGNTGTVLTADPKTGTYRPPTAEERARGKGTHLDITVYDEDGKKLSSREVASLLQTRLLG